MQDKVLLSVKPLAVTWSVQRQECVYVCFCPQEQQIHHALVWAI